MSRDASCVKLLVIVCICGVIRIWVWARHFAGSEDISDISMCTGFLYGA